MALSIPGVERVHAREAWQDPAVPVTGPSAKLAQIDQTVIHYPWADSPTSELPELVEDVAAWLRRTQWDWVHNRGYSLGYWWAVDWLGGVWQIRGRDFQSAANSGHNDHTAPILMLVDWDGAATSQALSAARAIQADDERHAIWAGAQRPFHLTRSHSDIATSGGAKPPGHRVLTPGASGCCGDGMRDQLVAGLFDPTHEGAGDMIHLLTHRRHFDSRSSPGVPLEVGRYTFGPFDDDGVPDHATGVIVNLTTTGSDGPGWLEIDQGVSVHNYTSDDNRNTVTTALLQPGGTLGLSVAAARTHLIIDVQGYTTP